MIFGRVILDNNDWLVAAGLLGGMEITLKSRGLTRRVPNPQRRYFFRLIEALKNTGVPIVVGSQPVEQAAEDFAEAMFGGELTQTAYFLALTPEQHAEHYIDQAPTTTASS